MIIDMEGNELQAFFRADGIVIEDHENGFAICVPYTQEQKEKFALIRVCKDNLSATDYKAYKYAEGWYTEEEYAPIRQEREYYRKLIRENQFEEPTLTREQMDEIEEKARQKQKERNYGGY